MWREVAERTTLGRRLMRRGVLGGTFDPIHVGHLDVARAAVAALALDHVLLMPSSLPPHRTTPYASARDRLAMVELAAQDDPALMPSDLELHADGPSYTTATLDRLAATGIDLQTICSSSPAPTRSATFRAGGTTPRFSIAVTSSRYRAPGVRAGSLRQMLPAVAPRMIDAPCAVPSHRPSSLWTRRPRRSRPLRSGSAWRGPIDRRLGPAARRGVH